MTEMVALVATDPVSLEFWTSLMGMPIWRATGAALGLQTGDRVWGSTVPPPQDGIRVIVPPARAILQDEKWV